MQSFAAATLDDAESFALEHASTPQMRDLLTRAFAGLRIQASQYGLVSFVDLPVLLHTALTGDEHAAHPLALATTLIALGAGALDDVADGEPRPEWRDAPANQMELAAVASLSVLPLLALRRIPVTPQRAIAMHDALYTGLLTMIEGQLADLASAGSSPDPDAVVASIVGKSGGELALFTRLAALLAGMDHDIVEHCAAMGRAMGVAAQIGADCIDIFQSEHSDDLTNGTRTLPIALHLHTLGGEDRKRFLRLLGAAQQDRQAQVAARDAMVAAGCVRQCALLTRVWMEKAHRHLSAVARFDPPAQVLRDWIELSAFERGKAPAGTVPGRG